MNQGQQPPQVQQGQQPPPPVVVFARTPATFQQNQLLNYAEKRDVEIYNKGSAALSGEQWDGKSVHALMVRVGERAGQYGWMPMLTFGARNLVTGYGDITREEVRLAAAAIQAANDRRTQDSDMLFRCLSASIKDTVHTVFVKHSNGKGGPILPRQLYGKPKGQQYHAVRQLHQEQTARAGGGKRDNARPYRKLL